MVVFHTSYIATAVELKATTARVFLFLSWPFPTSCHFPFSPHEICCVTLVTMWIFALYVVFIIFYIYKGHRRLLEHLTDPACPSIRRFIEDFPENIHCSENGPENGARNVSRSNTSQNGVQDSLEHGETGGDGTCTMGGKYEKLRRGVGTGQEEGMGERGGCKQNEAVALREAYNGSLKALQDFR